jgi:peptide/nickel transport system permease protein
MKVKGFLISIFAFLKRTWQGRFLLVVFFLVISAPLWMNERPLMRYDKGEFSFPFLAADKYGESYSLSADGWEVHALLPYSSTSVDPLNDGFVGPFDQQYQMSETGVREKISLRHRHWLGTNLRGNDLLADIIYGTRNSMIIALSGACLSLVFAAVFGFVGGWYFQTGIKTNIGRLLLSMVALLWILFIQENILIYSDKLIALIALLIFMLPLNWLLSRLELRFLRSNMSIRIDDIIGLISGLLLSLPRLVILLAIMQLLKPSLLSMIFLLGFTGWIELSRLIRSEIIRLKSNSFLDAAVMSGVKGQRLMLKHVLPNVWPSIVVLFIYTISGNTNIESILSFMGMGLPPDVPSLGRTIGSGKFDYEVWWIFFLPGSWLSMILYCFFKVAESFRKQLNS